MMLPIRVSLVMFTAIVAACSSHDAEQTDGGSTDAGIDAGPTGNGPLSNMPDRTYVTDGTVNAISRVGNTIYIAGGFDRVGPRTGPGAQVGIDGTWSSALPEVSGAGPNLLGGAATGVRAAIADGVGGWYISGLFTHVGGAEHTNVAHILANNSTDAAFQAAVDGNVEAIVLSGTSLYIAGAFGSVDGQLRSNIAALDASTGALRPFAPNADAEVSALAVSADGTIIYAGGNGFTTIGGQARGSLAALDATTGAALAFDPIIASTNGAPNIQALAVAGTVLYVAGYFDTINTTPRRTIAAVNANGTLVAGFAPAPSYFGCIPCASVVALAVSGTTVYVGGSFDTMGGAARNNVAGLGANGIATAFDPDASGNILSLAAAGNLVYVGGGFYSIGGANRNFAAVLNASDGSATAFDANPNGSVSAIATSEAGIYLGGQFSSLGGVLRAGLAAIDATSGEPTAWDPAAAGMNGNLAQINALVTTTDTAYVGGAFVTIGGRARQNLAAVSLADASATTWDPSSDGVVQALALSPTVVYAGGSFLQIGGQSRTFAAALDLTSGAASTWNPSPDNSITSIAVADDVVFLAGYFGGVGGQPRNAVAAVDNTAGHVTAWNANLAGEELGTYVYAVVVAGANLYVGGGFTAAQGFARHNAAALSIADATLTPFDPSTGGGDNDGAVAAIAIDGQTLYLGGSFASVGSESRALVGAVDLTTGDPLDFNPNGFGGVTIQALTVAPSRTLYAGGSFSTFALASQQGFAAFSPHP